jgi:hypothetical protein
LNFNVAEIGFLENSSKTLMVTEPTCAIENNEKRIKKKIISVSS